MDGEAVRRVLEAVLPEAELMELARELNVVQRQSKRDLVTFVRAMILGAGSARGGVQADALRAYLEFDVPHVTRQAFYRWFDPELESLMERLASRAMEYARSRPVDLPPLLELASDWWIVDSETVKVRDSLIEEFPGTGKYAAIKVHKTYSVGCGAPVAYHFSPAREHDSRHLDIDESWRGRGLLVDLGYVSLARLAACERHGVLAVVRLKENWKPRVQAVHRGEITKTFAPGADFDVLLDDGTIALSGKALDLEVQVGRGSTKVQMRLVAVPSPKGYCFYLTNLPRRVGPHQVASIYRVRWEIELSNKVDKSVHRLDESDAERPASIKTMLMASLIASVIASLLAHEHNIGTRPKDGSTERTEPPIHTNLLARAVAVVSLRLAEAFMLSDEDAAREWTRLATYLTRLGLDPNWRTRPSVLDEMKGWKRKPRGRRSSGA